MITGKILGDRYVINGVSEDLSGFVPDMSADIYYEVVRLINGKILFLPDHLERLKQSLSTSGPAFPGSSAIRENLRLLIRENRFRKGNIRICVRQASGKEPELQCYFIPYYYPTPGMYNTGVRMHIYPHVRPNPGIKKWDDRFRNSVSSYILEHGLYEVALKNQHNQITEGSRSNIFFIDRSGNLITAPGTLVLQGITRKYVLKLVAKEGIGMEERTVPADALDSMVSAFISGTSPKVLPVRQIDNYQFDVNHPLLRQLMLQFETVVQSNLSSL